MLKMGLQMVNVLNVSEFQSPDSHWCEVRKAVGGGVMSLPVVLWSDLLINIFSPVF